MNSSFSGNDGRCQVRLRVIQEIISSYHGGEPLHHFLASHFKKNHGFGSKDRRLYRKWVYAWYRLGQALSDSTFEHRLLIAYYLVNGLDDELSGFLNDKHSLSLSNDNDFFTRVKRVKSTIGQEALGNIFSFESGLSIGIDKSRLIESHLQQPDVFLRVRMGAEERVASEFSKLGLSFSKTDLDYCWRITTGSHLQETSSWKNGLFEVQDYNSQMVCQKIPMKPNEHWWDACSGAGGKTLFLADHVSGVSIFCSDIRERILEQLIQRLRRNHIHGVTTSVLDALTSLPHGKMFDGILVDAPCSGSGTWTRNPENLVFFDESTLTGFANRQLHMLQNTSQALKPGGYLTYITCSLFTIENEGVVSSFMLNKGYDLVVQEMLPGYLVGSDSLFIAVLKKNN